MKIQFYLRFQTSFGQTLWIRQLEESEPIPMTYVNEEFWESSVQVDKTKEDDFKYRYQLKTKEGDWIEEWGDDRSIDLSMARSRDLTIVDTWNHAGEYENVFFTAPFANILLKQKKRGDVKIKKQHTHVFKVKAPLLMKNECLCLLGNSSSLGNWSEDSPILMSKKGNWWIASVDLSEDTLPIAYKYGTYDTNSEKFIRFEQGDNRLLYGDSGKKKLTVLHDGFARLPNDTWKGAGVSVPVFSLRSKRSCGTGEFLDLKLLADWASHTGIRLIQILPVNDTTATHTWMDSYPYAAISAFALHPMYINLAKVAGKKNAAILKPIQEKQDALNALPYVNYEDMMKLKMSVLKELFENEGEGLKDNDDFHSFFSKNKHWLVPYAAFCYLRDQYGTSHFEQWPEHTVYNKKEIDKLTDSKSKHFKSIAFYYYVQFHLHLQLQDAVEYAHKKKVILKGDIPIGVYRYGCDAWTAPELYNMCQQAGAPPDDFAVRGQNWGFPTYNWKTMQEDGYDWWVKRFEQMSHYFDAFRIDHILGFFRIWSIPMHAVEGVMGRFIPAIPVTINEFGENGIWFEHHRYCAPYITEQILNDAFGTDADNVKKKFLNRDADGHYEMKPEFKTQRAIEQYFAKTVITEGDEKLQQGLYDLISNIILIEDEEYPHNYHFRIGMENTSSFKSLDQNLQAKLRDLYVNYFYRRQDDHWKKEAMHKLPDLKRATNMLVCGEDLGMVPHCVPEVMKQLGILSLEIQRMPKQSGKEFFHPNDAPYLSVVTPSTHDMSTIRGWWEEDKDKTRRFFTTQLGQHGDPPAYCEAWINRAIVMQHLYSPAMWSIFQLQDLLGMSNDLRREDPNEERINIPANPKHYWRYRMHIPVEDLMEADAYNEELRNYIMHSGRA